MGRVGLTPLALAVSILWAFVAIAQSPAGNPYVKDATGLLQPATASHIAEVFGATEAAANIRLRLLTVKSTGGRTCGQYAQSLVNEDHSAGLPQLIIVINNGAIGVGRDDELDSVITNAMLDDLMRANWSLAQQGYYDEALSGFAEGLAKDAAAARGAQLVISPFKASHSRGAQPQSSEDSWVWKFFDPEGNSKQYLVTVITLLGLLVSVLHREKLMRLYAVVMLIAYSLIFTAGSFWCFYMMRFIAHDTVEASHGKVLLFFGAVGACALVLGGVMARLAIFSTWTRDYPALTVAEVIDSWFLPAPSPLGNPTAVSSDVSASRNDQSNPS